MSLLQKRSTNVIWSFDSSCLKDELLSKLEVEKVDALRVVAERSDLEHAISFCRRIKQEVPQAREKLPIIADVLDHVRGSIIELETPKEIAFGEQIKIAQTRGKGDLIIKTDEWSTLFALNHSVFLGNGMVVGKVIGLEKDHVLVDIIQGGTIFPNADVQVPSTRTSLKVDGITAEALRVAADPAFDFLILPDVEDAAELKRIVAKFEGQAYCPWILLKVSSRATFEKLDELLPLVRGVLISRVALAMQMDPAQIPMITKEIIQKCNDYAKMSVVASEMLGSMRHNVTPTRAEVSDIANAVFDGADAVVLSEALAYGRYAERGLQLAIKTIEDAESSTGGGDLNWAKKVPEITNEIEAVTFGAYRAAYRNQAKAIVCFTKNGNTALHLSSFGHDTPIIAVTTNPDVIRRLRLVRGVTGMLLDSAPDIEQVTSLVNGLLMRKYGLGENDRYIFVSVTLSSLGKEASNLFTVQKLQ